MLFRYPVQTGGNGVSELETCIAYCHIQNQQNIDNFSWNLKKPWHNHTTQPSSNATCNQDINNGLLKVTYYVLIAGTYWSIAKMTNAWKQDDRFKGSLALNNNPAVLQLRCWTSSWLSLLKIAYRFFLVAAMFAGMCPFWWTTEVTSHKSQVINWN